MPKPPTPKEYQKAIKRLAADQMEDGGEVNVAEIHRVLRKAADEDGRDDCPVERTVGRIVRRWIDSTTEEERRQWATFRWPESMGLGGLPWEAGAVCLELLAYANGLHLPRSTVRMARTFWQVSLAVPDAPLPFRFDIATVMENRQPMGLPLPRDLEFVMAHAGRYRQTRPADAPPIPSMKTLSSLAYGWLGFADIGGDASKEEIKEIEKGIRVLYGNVAAEARRKEQNADSNDEGLGQL